MLVSADGACSYPEFIAFIKKDGLEEDADWNSEYYSQQLVRKYIRYHDPIDKFLGRQIQGTFLFFSLLTSCHNFLLDSLFADQKKQIMVP